MKFKILLIVGLALVTLSVQGQSATGADVAFSMPDSAIIVSRQGNVIPAIAALLPIAACFCSIRERRRR